jgi:hypothetical protein
MKSSKNDENDCNDGNNHVKSRVSWIFHPLCNNRLVRKARCCTRDGGADTSRSSGPGFVPRADPSRIRSQLYSPNRSSPHVGRSSLLSTESAKRRSCYRFVVPDVGVSQQHAPLLGPTGSRDERQEQYRGTPESAGGESERPWIYASSVIGCHRYQFRKDY